MGEDFSELTSGYVWTNFRHGPGWDAKISENTIVAKIPKSRMLKVI